MKILIVEDELLIAKVYEIQLKSFGYEVVALTTNVEAGMTKFNETNPDLVILDIRLKGGESGIDMAKKIRESSNIPLIFTTGNSKLNTFDELNNFENVSLLIKPVSPNELQKQVNKLLNN